jgi:CDP-diacylglycerol--serine O-phosphatidyltransferase
MNVSRERLRGLHINRMIPNTLTLLALACGLTALLFALHERWEPAVLAVVVAGVLDGLDGRIARILKGTTKFGAELDSLSDFLCFGVAPALILYLWSLNAAGRVGWWLVLLLCICCALRLARFNTIAEDVDTPPWQRSFFVGMPSPAGAGLALLPMVLWFQLDADFLRHPAFVGFCVAATSALLVCRLRTFTFKRVRIAQGWVLPAMLIVGLYFACLASNPWLTLAMTELAYLASIPVSVRLYRRRLREETALGAARTDVAPAPPA